MKKEEALELFKKDFMKITHDEYCERSREGEVKVVCEDETIYFKPKPREKMFKGECYSFIVDRTGFIKINDDFTNRHMVITSPKTIEALQEALNYSKEIKNGN